jgi:tetratricopeptide (TPR) repeat protein
MKSFGKSTNTGTAERLSKACFSLPHCSQGLLEQAMERADFSVSKGRDAWRTLAKAMGQYRAQDWSSALEWLTPLQTSNPMEAATLAWAFSAMAHQHLGENQDARQALEQVNRRLSVVIRTGQMSYWVEIARAFVIRDEAEQLILGKVTSAPLNPSEIVENRKTWQSVTFYLNNGSNYASRQQWVPAAEYYGKALQQPVFDWTVSELKEDKVPMQAAMAFLMAEETENFRNLARTLVGRKIEYLSPAMQERYGHICIMNPAILPPELKEQALAFARRVCDSQDWPSTFGMRLLRGETEYRQGHFDAAIDALDPLIFPPAETLGGARGKVFLAMAYKRLGKSRECAEAMQEANELFIKGTSQGSDRNNQMFFQIVMKELMAMVAGTPGAGREN